MRNIITALIGVLLLIPLVSAHAIDKGPVSRSTEDYIIEFLTVPKFPAANKHIHLDFIIKDKNGNLMSNINVKIELHKEETTITLDLEEEEKGHYSVEYEFSEAGEYEIHPIIDNKELETEFNLEVDGFGLSGLLRSGAIIILLLIFITVMIRDCKNKQK